MVLGCSRKAARFLTFRSSSRIWAELHEKAFRRLGGATRVVVLDNLREGVLVPDIYDPTLNPLYRDVLAHYGAVALPCRIKDPDRKGKVESGVGHAQRALQGKRFESLEEAQAYLDRWRQAVPIPAFMALRNDKSPPCLPKKNQPCYRFPGTFSLLPAWQAGRESGWLRRSRCRLLRPAPGLDRTRSVCAVG